MQGAAVAQDTVDSGLMSPVVHAGSAMSVSGRPVSVSLSVFESVCAEVSGALSVSACLPV